MDFQKPNLISYKFSVLNLTSSTLIDVEQLRPLPQDTWWRYPNWQCGSHFLRMTPLSSEGGTNGWFQKNILFCMTVQKRLLWSRQKIMRDIFGWMDFHGFFQFSISSFPTWRDKTAKITAQGRGKLPSLPLPRLDPRISCCSFGNTCDESVVTT